MLLLTLLLLALIGLLVATFASVPRGNAELGPDVWPLIGAALLPWLIGVSGLFGLLG